jgi:hypothetical protein
MLILMYYCRQFTNSKRAEEMSLLTYIWKVTVRISTRTQTISLFSLVSFERIPKSSFTLNFTTPASIHIRFQPFVCRYVDRFANSVKGTTSNVHLYC